MVDITSGGIVSGLDPSELVEIQRIAPFGSEMLVEGVGVQSRKITETPLAPKEIDKLVKDPWRTVYVRQRRAVVFARNRTAGKRESFQRYSKLDL